MGNFNSNFTDIQQDFYNNITQINQQECISQSSAGASGNVVIIQNSTINGEDVGINVTSTQTDASCLMVSSMDTSITNILEAIAQQTNTSVTDLFNDFSIDSQVNVADIDQSVVNNITQISEALCEASSISSAENNYVYINNSDVNANFIGVNVSTSDTSANCTMSNYMKAVTYNQAQASVSQANTSIGIFAIIMAVIAIVMIVLIIAIIIIFAIGSSKYVEYAKVKGKEVPALTEEQQLGALLVSGLGKKKVPPLPKEGQSLKQPLPSKQPSPIPSISFKQSFPPKQPSPLPKQSSPIPSKQPLPLKSLPKQPLKPR